MSEFSFLALAFGLGLLGFIEPCSIGANGIFLGYLQKKDRNLRTRETVRFALARAVILGLFGLSAAFLGNLIFSAQKGFWLVLGLVYLALGLVVILNASFGWGIFGRLSMGRFLSRHHALGMGFLFGLNLPACAYPLLLALLGRSVASGVAWGFVALFICLRLRPLSAAPSPGPLRSNGEGIRATLPLQRRDTVPHRAESSGDLRLRPLHRNALLRPERLIASEDQDRTLGRRRVERED